MKKILFIFLFAFLIRLVFYRFFNYTPWIYNDEAAYLIGARGLLQGMVVIEPNYLNFPIFYSVLLTPVIILTSNPILQYKIGLVITTVIVSVIPVAVYYVASKHITKNKLLPIIISLVASLHPSIFVYSGALMSEGIYTLMLFATTALILYKGKNINRVLYLVIPFILVLMFWTRSIGLFAAISYIAALILFNIIKRRRLHFFISLFIAGILGTIYFIDKKYFGLGSGHYEGSDYVFRIMLLLTHPIKALSLLFQNITGVIALLCFVPLLLINKENLRKAWKLYPLLLLFLMFNLVSNILIVVIHSANQAIVKNNSEYMMLMRYLDPTIFILFVYSIIALYKAKKDLLKYVIITSVTIILVYIFFRNIDWKFSNNISIILLNNRSILKVVLFMTASVLLPILAFWIVNRTQFKKYSYFAFVFTITVFLVMYIYPSINGPLFAEKNYDNQINYRNMTSENIDINNFLNLYRK